MNKNKIFFVDPMSYNNLAIYDWNLINNLLGEEVCFFGNVQYYFKTLNTSTHLIFNYSQKRFKLSKAIQYIFNMLQLFFFIIKDKPKIIHFQWLKMPQFDVYFIRILKLFNRKTKIVYTAHNFLPHDSKQKYLVNFTSIYELVDSIITHTEATKLQISELNITPDKISVIKHGILQINFDENEVLRLKKEFQKKYDLKKSTICLNIGLINRYKGTDLLLKVWNDSLYLRDNRKLNLIVAGKGDSTLLKNTANNVTIINRFLNDNEFVALIKLADLIILPYRKISQSGVLLTVLSFKKPILVTDVGGLSEPLTYENIGWKLEADNLIKLSKKLESILASPSDLKKIEISDDKWNHIFSVYSWKNIGKDTSDLYERLCIQVDNL